MSKIQERFTPLLPVITSILKQYENKKQLEKVIFDQKLRLALIEKTPVACISDFRHSIQASFSKKQTFHAHPFNKHRFDYYTVIDKSWVSLNAAQKYVGEAKEFPSPYDPYFHFKKNYKEYVDNRPGLNFRVQCQPITIYSWSLKVVNISNTGYYCVVIHVLDSQRKGDRFVQNIGNISSIIYEPEIQQKMEAFRLLELRNNYKQAKDIKVPYSLFYYFRDSEPQAQLKRRPNNIITVDTAQKFLNHDANKPQKLVCFGQMEGISCLQYPMKNAEIDKQKIKALHTQNIDIFFNYLEKQAEKTNEKQNAPMLWSSESQSQGSYHSSQENLSEKDGEGEEESEESNEDPLRNLYLKQFSDLKLQ